MVKLPIHRSCKMKYEIMEDYIIQSNDDGSTSSIPTDPANSDYQAYLKSLENAN